MTAKRLFTRRCADNFRFQVQSLRMGIDWTVLIYLIIPAVVIAIVVYRSWWLDLPEWMEILPLDGFLFFFYIFSWFGTVRLFIEEADQLFLLQNRSFYLSLRRSGIVYSLGKQAVLTSLFMILFLPYFSKLQFTTLQLLQLFIVLALWKMTLLLMKDLCFYWISKRWLRICMFVLLFIVCYHIYSFFMLQVNGQVIFSIILLIAGMVLIRWKTTAVGHFFTEVEREFDAKYKIASLMLMHSGVIEKQNFKRRKKPWIFRRSQRLFSRRELDAVMLEQYIKIWLRKPQHLFSYFRFIGVSTVALFLFPANWGIVLVLIILFLFYQMVRSEWESYAKSHFIEMMMRDFDTLFFVKTKVICLFSLPIYIVIFVIYGLATSHWLLALIVFTVVAVILFIPWIQFKLERS